MLKYYLYVNKIKMKQVILTESQVNMLIKSHILVESIFDTNSIQKIKKYIDKMLIVGCSIATIYGMIGKFCDNNNIPLEQKEQVMNIVNDMVHNQKNSSLNNWKLVDNKTIATVYNAIPEQCNKDIQHTASMFKLNLNDVLSQRVIAMERTYMKKLGLKYGDVVYIEGTNKWDGVWQIQDTMNKRFAGQHKIDILVPNNIRYGKWDNVKLYVLKDKSLTNQYRSQMAPSYKNKQRR
jgi:hypothetical protein